MQDTITSIKTNFPTTKLLLEQTYQEKKKSKYLTRTIRKVCVLTNSLRKTSKGKHIFKYLIHKINAIFL